MPDPAFEYYAAEKPLGDYSQRDKIQIIKDLNFAHDNIRKLVKEKDLMREEFYEKLSQERRWRKMMVSAFVATWAGIWGLVQFALPYVVKGMLHGN
jgi:hypothetical protein